MQPRADPSQIVLRYEGADRMELENGALRVFTTLAHLHEKAPYAYQTGNDDTRDIKVGFALEGDELHYKLGSYHRRSALVIDPIVVFATFSGSVADNFGFTGTYDQGGFAYSGGTVYDVGFPTTAGAFQTSFQGGHRDEDENEIERDCGILKYSPDGKSLIWATYIGGGHNEQPHSMIVNSAGDLIILGTTFSGNFPVGGSAFDRSYNGEGDIFVFKLHQDGGIMLGSTYIGGLGRDGLNGISADVWPNGPLAYNYGDMFRGEVIVDRDDNIIIATSTQSFNFPVIGGFQSSYRGQQDGVVVKLNTDLSNVLWSSYLGGTDADAAYGVNIDRSGNIFVCGGTESLDFPATANSASAAYSGQRDGYLVKIRSNGSAILAATFVGTDKYDQAYFVQIDEFDQVYVTGQTTGNFPVTPGLYANGGGKQFIAVYGNDLATRTRSTVFGSGRATVDISPSAFLVDLCGRVYVSGWGGGTNRDHYNRETGTTHGMAVTPDAYQSKTDGSDFYLIILSRNMTSIVYGSYFGGSRSHEHVDGGTSRFDRDGKVYQSVCGGCGGFSDFPTTDDAWSRVNRGKRPGDPFIGGCNNAFFKLDLNSSSYPPQFSDITLTVKASELLEYDFTVTDADPQDSIFLYMQSDIFNSSKTPAPLATFTVDSGMNSIRGSIRWQTNCNHAKADTYIVYITVRDNGCPTPRVTTGKIKIVVLPPPIPDPPSMFCLKRVDGNTLELAWGEFILHDYFKEYRLVKRYASGKEEIVKTITQSQDISYIDNNSPDHETEDYCYFIYGINICGTIGDSTRLECSVPDKDSIPTSGYIHTVTVENNESIRVVWNQYDKLDFYRYHIYRKENKPDGDFRLYRILKDRGDTSFLDSNVNVHEKSYCYKIYITNQCGLESPEGNFGCSILLKGKSVPFENHVNWSPYEEWPGGVERYEIIRRDPSRQDSIVGTTPTTQQQFMDDKLDYDQGLYWYKIIAYENDGQNAISVSNEILLVQAPLVYVPNAFTPNGDSTNDVWKVVPVFVKDFHLKIYNRWGGLVWETHNKKDLWDGTWKARLPFDNVFIWQLDYTGWDKSKHFRNGNVTIFH